MPKKKELPDQPGGEPMPEALIAERLAELEQKLSVVSQAIEDRLLQRLDASLESVQQQLGKQITVSIDTSVRSYADTLIKQFPGAAGILQKLSGDDQPPAPGTNVAVRPPMGLSLGSLLQPDILNKVIELVQTFRAPNDQEQVAKQFSLIFRGMQLGQKIAKSGQVGEDLEKAFTETFSKK